MTEQEGLINSLKREIADYDTLLIDVNTLTDSIPSIQERKKEAEAKLHLAESAPQDFCAEFLPILVPIQLHDEEQLSFLVRTLGKVVPYVIESIENSSGSISAYQTALIKISDPNIKKAEWAEPVMADFSKLAQGKVNIANHSQKLDKININLGKTYEFTLDSIEKARSNNIGVDVATLHMRDVLEQIWGGLIDLARSKGSKKLPSLEFKKVGDRNIVAEILCEDDNKKKKMVILLANMHELHSDLSQTELSKNPLSNNLTRMEELFERWILQIDDLVNILCLI